MRTKRIRATASMSSLERLRTTGAGPDPGFRAGLRERLMAAATAGQTGSHDPGRGRGAAKPVD